MLATVQQGDRVYVEGVGGYKDAAMRFKSLLLGRALVESVTPKGDKVSRASVLEPMFEAGNVVLRRAAWNSDWIKEFSEFPSGRHDDQVDSLVLAVSKVITQPNIFVG